MTVPLTDKDLVPKAMEEVLPGPLKLRVLRDRRNRKDRRDGRGGAPRSGPQSPRPLGRDPRPPLRKEAPGEPLLPRGPCASGSYPF